MRNLICLLVWILSSTGCEGTDLDQAPLDPITPDNYFNSETEFQSAIDSVSVEYERLSIFINHLDAAYLEVNNDEKYQSFKDKKYNPSDALIYQLWGDAYRCLRSVHFLLDNIYSSSILTNSFKTKSIGQLLAIRGYVYLNLSLWYGKAPLVMKVLTINDGFYIGASDRNVILTEVIADLEVAFDTYANTETVYINREQIEEYLIQAHLLKHQFSEAASLIDKDNISSNSFYMALNKWWLGEGKLSVMNAYKNAYKITNSHSGKMLLDIMDYNQDYFKWNVNHLSLLPIPINEIDLNPNMTQNPGY